MHPKHNKKVQTGSTMKHRIGWHHQKVTMSTIPTSERLAQVLELNNAPAWMIEAARAGTYDDCKSELAFQLRPLIADSRIAHIPCMIPG